MRLWYLQSPAKKISVRLGFSGYQRARRQDTGGRPVPERPRRVRCLRRIYYCLYSFIFTPGLLSTPAVYTSACYPCFEVVRAMQYTPALKQVPAMQYTRISVVFI